MGPIKKIGKNQAKIAIIGLSQNNRQVVLLIPIQQVLFTTDYCDFCRFFPD